MDIFRGTNIILSVNIDNKTKLKQTLKGEDRIQCEFTLDTHIKLQIGDYVNWRGQTYTIRKEPSVHKLKANEYKYSFTFDSHLYKLLDSKFFLEGQAEFNLMGDIGKFANLIIDNLNRTNGPGAYSLGSVTVSETKNITFQNANCLQALQTIASEFSVEYELSSDGTTIDIKDKIGTITDLTFEFKKELRNILRKKLKDQNVVTNLYAFGGNRNIPSDYGGKRLKIDMIENNVNLFGKVEGIVTFEDIYPRREGVVSDINGTDIMKFTDASMDFNINDQLIDGLAAKITFNTGYLAGYEFEIHNYNHTTKEFDIILYQDTNGTEFPNDTLAIQVGDKYVIHDIQMPESYVTNAEAELLTKATTHLNENSLPNVVYEIVPNFIELRSNNITLNLGDIIDVVDKDLDITLTTRIIELTQSLANPHLYTIKVGDKVSVGFITQSISNQISLENTIYNERENRTQQLNRVRRTLLNIDALKDLIFDPDGYFDTDHIKPLSIETTMLAVGAKGQQFTLSGCLIEPNFGGNPLNLNIGNGTLSHFTIQENGVRNWLISNQSFTLSDPTKAYYIYAQCDKTGNSGSFVIDEAQIQTNENPGLYHFLIGVVHIVVDGVRGISLTYGQTAINGKFITTGKVQSADGNTYLDLDNNKLNVGNATAGIDWNVTNPDTLTIRGGVVQNPSGVQTPIVNYRGEWLSHLVYYPGDQVTYSGSSFVCDVETTPGMLPSNSNYWTVTALAGEDGDVGETGPSIIFRGDFDSNTAYYRTSLRRDVVQHNGTYYIKKTFYESGPYPNLPFDINDWEIWGAQFEVIATNTLLAENAILADWVIKNGKISSQSVVSGTTTPKVILDGENGVLKMSGLTGSNDYRGVSELKDEGLFIESSGERFNGPIAGSEWVAGISSVVVRDMANNFDNGRLLAAVYGKAVNSNAAGCRTFGGYFVNLMARGFFTKVVKLYDSSNYTVEDHIVTVICEHTGATKTVYLPYYTLDDEREKGRVIIVKTKSAHTYLNANTGGTIDGSNSHLIAPGNSLMVQFDGDEWIII